MKGVVDNIIVKPVGDEDWELVEPFDWYGITVPAGFVTDFASIPRPLWSFINPVGRIKPAALVHDFLYNRRGVLISPIFRFGKEKEVLTRKECDLEFMDIMERVGMKWWKRHAAYRGVRLGGWYFWNKKGAGD